MIDAKTVREVATKYIYDKCPAVVGIGELCIIVHSEILPKNYNILYYMLMLYGIL